MPVVNYHTIDELLLGETNASGARRDYLTNAFGSVVHTVDQAVAKVKSYRYQPYGGFTVQINTEAVPWFAWTGESGSYRSGAPHAQQYNRPRQYGKGTGTWTSIDPLWPDEWACAYVRGDPTTCTDPLGFAPLIGKWIRENRPGTSNCLDACAKTIYDLPRHK